MCMGHPSANRTIGMQGLAQLQALPTHKNIHIAMFPIGAHLWCRVLGMPSVDQLQAQIISRAMKLLRFCPVIPAHRKPPWPGYMHGLRLFTKLLVAHPLVGVCLPPEIRPVDLLKLTRYICRLSLHSRTQRWLVCRNGMRDHPLGIPRRWWQNRTSSHCSATIAADGTQPISALPDPPHSSCRGQTLRMEPVEP